MAAAVEEGQDVSTHLGGRPSHTQTDTHTIYTHTHAHMYVQHTHTPHAYVQALKGEGGFDQNWVTFKVFTQQTLGLSGRFISNWRQPVGQHNIHFPVIFTMLLLKWRRGNVFQISLSAGNPCQHYQHRRDGKYISAAIYRQTWHLKRQHLIYFGSTSGDSPPLTTPWYLIQT